MKVSGGAPRYPARRRSGAFMGSLAAKLLLALVALAVVLGGLEAGFRVLDLRGHHEPRTRDWEHALLSEAERMPGIGIQFRPGSEFRLDYDSDPRGYFDEQGGLRYRINRHGFRGPDFERQKAPGTQRLLVLGDSFTFGEGVRFEDTFARRLEGLLDEGDGPVEVLNLGVSGWATRHEILYLEREGLAFGPDLVLVVYVLNDAQYRARLNLWNDFREAWTPPAGLRGSYLASWVYARIGRHVLGQRYVEDTLAQAERERGQLRRALGLLAKGKGLAAGAGARFAVAIFPFLYRLDDGYPFAALHREVAAACRERGIPVLDLFPAFRGQSYAELWVHPSDQHPNERAHAIAARALAEFVREAGLL